MAEAENNITDYFLKLDTIEGESKDSNHSKEIDILGWSFGASQAATGGAGGGSGAGKAQFNALSISLKMCKASPKLMISCATGKHLKTGVLTARKAGGGPKDYYTITLTNLLITSYNTGGSSEFPIDRITLAAEQISVSYKPQSAAGALGGAVTFGYNIVKNAVA